MRARDGTGPAVRRLAKARGAAAEEKKVSRTARSARKKHLGVCVNAVPRR